MKVKKIIGVVLVIAVMCAMSVSVSAATLEYSKTHAHPDCFLTDWQIQIEYLDEKETSVIGVLMYGYDTDFIDEDYANTRGYNSYYSRAGLKRGTGSKEWASKKTAGYLSTINRTHNSDSVSYYIELSK